MPQFESLYTELVDLAQDDPMRPAAIVHVLGSDAEQCYDEVRFRYSTYVIGRGVIPPEVEKQGYFFTASLPDYPVLQAALVDYWPEMPDFPASRDDDLQPITSQEMADVFNYVAHPSSSDSDILQEALRHLQGLVPRRHIRSTAWVVTWLVENMLPANNCFTLTPIFARWLKEHGVNATYCTGQATFMDMDDSPVTIPHAWVEVNGEKCDLTVNHQSAWGDVGPVRRIRVDDPRVVYQVTGTIDYDFWLMSSKPADRRPYTEASRHRQREMINEIGILSQERRLWIDHIWSYGIAEGTYQLLLDKFGSTGASSSKRGGRRRKRARRRR